jgi:small-conductance mechanosensitive channel
VIVFITPILSRLRLFAYVAPARTLTKDPAPQVFFIGFGDSSLDFELGVWTIGMAHRPKAFRSSLNFAIDHAFREAHIEIPFPQRDLHVRSGRLDVRMDRT